MNFSSNLVQGGYLILNKKIIIQNESNNTSQMVSSLVWNLVSNKLNSVFFILSKINFCYSTFEYFKRSKLTFLLLFVHILKLNFWLLTALATWIHSNSMAVSEVIPICPTIKSLCDPIKGRPRSSIKNDVKKVYHCPVETCKYFQKDHHFEKLKFLRQVCVNIFEFEPIH